MSCEASVLVKGLSDPRDSAKVAIGNVAGRLRWKYSRTWNIWYGRARRIDSQEMDKLRAEARKQADLYDRVARAMEQTDQDFYSEDIASLVHAARVLRGVDRAGNDGEA